MTHEKQIYYINPSDPESFEKLNILLKGLRFPGTVIQHIVKGDSQSETTAMSIDSLKLEKYEHRHDTKIFYTISTQELEMEFRLIQPIKAVTKVVSCNKHITYAVVQNTVAKGAYGSVKGSHLCFTLDDNHKLHSDMTYKVIFKRLLEQYEMRDNHIVNIFSENDFKNELDVTQRYLGQDAVLDITRNKANKKIYEIAMPWLPETLATHLKSGAIKSLTIAERFKLLLNITEELHLFYRKTNHVHHDLKPDNISVDLSSTLLTVKLMDFGLSRLINSERSEAIGTAGYCDHRFYSTKPLYSHPEQDLFSLAFVAYEIIIGGLTNPIQHKKVFMAFHETKQLDISLIEELEPSVVKDYPEFIFIIKNLCSLNEERMVIPAVVKSLISLVSKAEEVAKVESTFRRSFTN